MAKKKTVLQITFISGGKTIEKQLADAIDGVIEIGKDHSCPWRPTSADLTMREHHARLTAKGDLDVRLEPIDGAPMTKNAHPFSGGKIAPNDRIAIGDSEIQVREVPKIIKSKERYHRLEGMNGEMKDKLFAMAHDPMTIGSAADCDLVIKSDIVAPRQAELATDEHGAVWIRDLGSRNGTFVNGERLTDKARMIKHADVLGFSIWDFRFLDRTVAHTRANTGRQLLLAILTVFICVGGYYAWLSRSLGTIQIFRESAAMIAAGDVDGGYKRFLQCYDAQDVGKYREQIAYARLRISRWHNAWADWEQFKHIVKTGRANNFDGVLDVMGRIRPDVVEDWSWQADTTADRMAEAAEGEAMMSLYFTVNKFLQGHVMTEEEIASINARFKKFGIMEKGWVEKDSREWIRPLRQALADGAKEVQTHAAEIERVNAEIRKCGTSVADLQAEVERLNQLEHKSSGYLRTFATSVLDPLSVLVEAAQVVASNKVLIANCQPDQLLLDLVLPTSDECLINGRLGEIREHYLRKHAEVKLAASRMKRALRLLERAKVSEEEFNFIEPLLRRETWLRLVKCDTFNVAPPSRKRTEPVSEYDKYLGIEWVWGFIKQFPLAYPDEVRYEDVNGAEFDPVIIRGLRRSSALRQADAIFMSKTFDEYRNGALASVAKRINTQLGRGVRCRELLDKIIEEEKDSRTELIAYACRLMLTDIREIKPEQVKRLKELTVIRRQRLDELISSADDAPEGSEKAKQCIDAILAEGVPGDVRILPYWKAKFPETAKEEKKQ